MARRLTPLLLACGLFWSDSAPSQGQDAAAGSARAGGAADRAERAGEEAREKTVSLQRGRVRTPSGVTFDVEVVSDAHGREQGLKHRSSVPPDTGMLFVFPTPGRHRFWMYECLTSLDIIWMDAERRVIHVAERLPACEAQPCPDYGPDKEALYVLEVGPGVSAKAGIRAGAKLALMFAEPPHPS